MKMYSLIYMLYFSLRRGQKKEREGLQKVSRFRQTMIDRIEWFYNIPVSRWYSSFPSKKCGLNKKNREQKVIISLTSYPKRINTIWMTIETLLRQTVKPDQIILWLAETQFNGLESLPQKLLKLQERGLTIRFCQDLRSHKKYFNVMQEYMEDIVILVDDDMLYPYNLVNKLLKLHEKFPDDICTMTAQVIEKGKKPSEWRNPYINEYIVHSDKIQIFSGSGSLYPPHALSKEVFNEDKIRRFCPYADDLWLTFMARRKGTKITMENPWRAFPVTIYGTGANSLYYVNAEKGQNDVQWENLCEMEREDN